LDRAAETVTTEFDAQPILLIEDNEDDAFIFRRAFSQARLRHPLHAVDNGQQAMEYLSGVGRFADRAVFPVPFLTLLDLKLPLRNGLDVLEWIRAQPPLAALSVVVLTSSAEPRDLARARELGARAYLVKPPTVPVLVGLFGALRAAQASDEHRLIFEGDLLNRPTGER
jgi:CheY-like chemotaxis protein